MVYGFDRRSGLRGGAGFGFRGTSPPWPYVGRGRGGLPRCRYPGTVAAPPNTPASAYPPLTRREELDWLKRRAEAVKTELDRIETRIKGLESTQPSQPQE